MRYDSVTVGRRRERLLLVHGWFCGAVSKESRENSNIRKRERKKKKTWKD